MSSFGTLSLQEFCSGVSLNKALKATFVGIEGYEEYALGTRFVYGANTRIFGLFDVNSSGNLDRLELCDSNAMEVSLLDVYIRVGVDIPLSNIGTLIGGNGAFSLPWNFEGLTT